MIDQYKEFCDYLKLLYEYSPLLDKSNKKNDDRISRMEVLFTKAFVFPIKDTQGNYKNDFYTLKAQDKKRRLSYSIAACTYLYNGHYEGDKPTKKGLLQFFKKYYKDNDYINKIVERNEQGITSYKYKDKNDKEIENLKYKDEISPGRFYYVNQDAVIRGPLIRNQAVYFSSAAIKKIYQISRDREDFIDKIGKPKIGVFRVAIMALSYCKFLQHKLNKKTVSFNWSTFQTFGSVKNYLDGETGFKSTELLTLERFEDQDKIYAYIHKDIYNDIKVIIKPEGHDKSYFDEENNFYFIDEGIDTFTNLSDLFKENLDKIEQK